MHPEAEQYRAELARTAPQEERQGEVAALSGEIDRLLQQLGFLAESLEPVLRPARPSEVGPDAGGGSSLSLQRMRVQAVTQSVMELRERVDA